MGLHMRRTRRAGPDSSPSSGYMVVPAGGGGTFLGGYVVKKLNLRCRGIVRFCVTCTLMSLATIFIFLVHCPDLPMAGVTAPYRSGLTEQPQLYDRPARLRLRNRWAASVRLLMETSCSSSLCPLPPAAPPWRRT